MVRYFGIGVMARRGKTTLHKLAMQTPPVFPPA
jgi:hypothetical protein